MNEKEYEPIDPQDLKDFALLDVNDEPRTERAKLIILRAVCLQKMRGGVLISCITGLSYYERKDLRWQWHLTPSESTQLIQILASSLEAS
ncbi:MULTISPECIES: hypothetical protein [unclassified Microcoleus]|uniref:hypothetical protein n=1 Tax=unclassified Microcoleus TaxID=2642155 RepID=UPI002FD4170F